MDKNLCKTRLLVFLIAATLTGCSTEDDAYLDGDGNRFGQTETLEEEDLDQLEVTPLAGTYVFSCDCQEISPLSFEEPQFEETIITQLKPYRSNKLRIDQFEPLITSNRTYLILTFSSFDPASASFMGVSAGRSAEGDFSLRGSFLPTPSEESLAFNFTFEDTEFTSLETRCTGLAERISRNY